LTLTSHSRPITLKVTAALRSAEKVTAEAWKVLEVERAFLSAANDQNSRLEEVQSKHKNEIGELKSMHTRLQSQVESQAEVLQQVDFDAIFQRNQDMNNRIKELEKELETVNEG